MKIVFPPGEDPILEDDDDDFRMPSVIPEDHEVAVTITVRIEVRATTEK